MIYLYQILCRNPNMGLSFISTRGHDVCGNNSTWFFHIQRESSLGRLLDNKSCTIHRADIIALALSHYLAIAYNSRTVLRCHDKTRRARNEDVVTHNTHSAYQFSRSCRCRAKRVSRRLYPGGRLGDAPSWAHNMKTNELRERQPTSNIYNESSEKPAQGSPTASARL